MATFWGKKTADMTPEERAARAEYYRQRRRNNPGMQARYNQANRERFPERYAAHRAKMQALHKEKGYGERYRDRVKVEVLTHYGGGRLACVLCGFANPDALCLDHINDDGKEHRALVGKKLYGPLKAAGYPPGLQTLCQNCNWIKETARRRAMRAGRAPAPAPPS